MIRQKLALSSETGESGIGQITRVLLFPFRNRCQWTKPSSSSLFIFFEGVHCSNISQRLQLLNSSCRLQYFSTKLKLCTAVSSAFGPLSRSALATASTSNRTLHT